MKLGDYEIPYYPSDFVIPRPFRSNSYLETYESVRHFSWGFFISGKIVDLIWNFMPSEQFNELDTLWQDDKEIEWDPDISGLDATYNVQILDFVGEFYERVGEDAEIWRRNCRMSLLILSEA